MGRNTYGTHTSNSDCPQALMPAVLGQSSFVTVMVNFNDIDRLYWLKSLTPPCAVFVGRHIQHDIQGGMLHNKYKQLQTIEQSYALGVWWAEEIASMALPRGLDWLHWLGNPNEINDVSPKAPEFARGFINRGKELGIKTAVGCYSYGLPKIPPHNPENEWEVWTPTFRRMDELNRDSQGNALLDFETILTLHEYAMGQNMLTSMRHAMRRYKDIYDQMILPYNWFIPLGITELGYAGDAGGWPGDTNVVKQQLLDYMAIIQNDPYLIGFGMYDLRASSDQKDFEGHAAAVAQTLQQRTDVQFVRITPPGANPPVPPEEPPVQTAVSCSMMNPSVGWLWIRSGPGLGYSQIGKFVAGDGVLLHGEALANVGVQKSWIWVDGTLLEPDLKGWMASWLIKRDE